MDEDQVRIRPRVRANFDANAPRIEEAPFVVNGETTSFDLVRNSHCWHGTHDVRIKNPSSDIYVVSLTQGKELFEVVEKLRTLGQDIFSHKLGAQQEMLYRISIGKRLRASAPIFHVPRRGSIFGSPIRRKYRFYLDMFRADPWELWQNPNGFENLEVVTRQIKAEIILPPDMHEIEIHEQLVCHVHWPYRLVSRYGESENEE